MRKQSLSLCLLFLVNHAHAIEFLYEVPGALIYDTASDLQGPFDDWKIWCKPVIISTVPEENQDDVEPGFVNYHMTCKEDQ